MKLPSEKLPSTEVTKTRNCAHWADQLQRLFPQTETPVTIEFIHGMVAIMGMYPESMVAEICSPTIGLCTKYKFLPTLMELKSEFEVLSEKGRTQQEIISRRQAQLSERQEADMAVNIGTNKTYAELMAPLPAALRVGGEAVYRDKPLTDEQFLAKYPFVTQADLDACPDVAGGAFKKLG